ncbi:DUF4292 domain-containing protein [Flavobacterium arcticum]|uniref:DUF4292 domain-containing protein n=1 Tax=Flavobacterium arcticum TaxID=1784713 RepID=A0A345HAW6_9FLAO|nr:DUF4292 domain-containing protein [Flavobacterium arcticum]AXG73726.1 DUF4292 domain-containing protein [Flavobacterium arcticum]KAF2511677.1 DUF4292 domain-containing protein [Flavobacterium arcticum]
MRKITALLLLTVVFFTSCKSKQAVLGEQGANKARTTAEIIKGHYANEKDFNTLYIKADVRYSDKHTSQKLSADIRVKKDEKILVSLKFLGITMAKALITPDGVTYYEKLNNTYFDGNYAMLSRWLGADLDYAKVQNLILGKAIYNLKDDTYTAKIESGLYRLSSNSGGIMKSFLFEGSNYLLKRENIAQGGLDARSLDIQYPAHREYPKAILPAEIKIDAQQKDKVTIQIGYNTVTFDEDFSFPFNVPQGFDQIFLD